ncbi:hypothetical protein KM043_013901 [Ampulex compressa]|nr:hypothetical protein KM043_013901 [Ampulex compressa]
MSGQSGGHRLRLSKLNEQLTCKLCGGYFIDATTIIECLHSFCRSCIVKYLENNKYCPICEVQVHKSRPLLNIRPDHTLQDIVYKLVPGCYQNEMKCRREFYSKHPEVCGQATSPEARGEPIESHIYSPDESLSLSLEYFSPHKDSGEEGVFKELSTKSLLRRYLRCPAAVTVFHLQKLIRAKYGLSDVHRVDIMYKEEPLCASYTLMDVMYIYHWRRKVPLHLSYRIFESSPKRLKLSEDNAGYKKSLSYAGIDSSESKEEKGSKREWKEVQLKISETGVMSITDISSPEIKNSPPRETSPEKQITPEVEIIPKKSEEPKQTILQNLQAPESPPRVSDSSDTPVSNGENPLEKVQESVGSESKPDKQTVEAEKQPRHNNNNNINTDAKPKPSLEVRLGNASSKLDALSAKLQFQPRMGQVNNTYSKKAPKEKRLPLQTLKRSPEPNCGKITMKLDCTEASPTQDSLEQTINVQQALNLLERRLSSPESTPRKTQKNNEDPPVSSCSVTQEFSVTKTTETSSSDSQTTSTSSKSCMSKQNSSKLSLDSYSVPPCPDAIPISLMKPMIRKHEVITKGTNLNVICAKIGTSGSKINDICAKIGESSKEKSRSEARCRSEIPELLKIARKGQGEKLVPNIPNVPVYTPGSVSLLNDNKPSFSKGTPGLVPGSQVQRMPQQKKQPQAVGYKTLRDPPKSWNPTLSKNNYVAVKNQSKEVQVEGQLQSAEDRKQIQSKPAKIFKMRNMPRYLGNPASGVKPMYGIGTEPKDKDQLSTVSKSSSTLSMMKIDPKTLSPIVSTVNSPIVSPPPYSPCARSYQNTPFSRDMCRNTGSPISPRNSPVNMLSTNPFIPSPTPNTNPRLIYSHFPPPFPDASRFPNPLIRSPIGIPPPSAFHSSLPPSINKLYQRSSYIPQAAGFSTASQPPTVQRIPPSTYSSSPKSPKAISGFTVGKVEPSTTSSSSSSSSTSFTSSSSVNSVALLPPDPNQQRDFSAFNLSKNCSIVKDTELSVSSLKVKLDDQEKKPGRKTEQVEEETVSRSKAMDTRQEPAKERLGKVNGEVACRRQSVEDQCFDTGAKRENEKSKMEDEGRKDEGTARTEVQRNGKTET